MVFRLDAGAAAGGRLRGLNAMWYELMEGAAIRHDKLDTPVTSQTTR